MTDPKTLATLTATVLIALAAAGCRSRSAEQTVPAKPATTQAAPQAADGIDAAATFQSACKKCHSLDRIRRHATLPADQQNWPDIIQRMKAKGLTVTADQETAILSFLQSGKEF